MLAAHSMHKKTHPLDRQPNKSWGAAEQRVKKSPCVDAVYLGSGRMIFLLARAAGVDLLFSIAIK